MTISSETRVSMYKKLEKPLMGTAEHSRTGRLLLLEVIKPNFDHITYNLFNNWDLNYPVIK